MEQIKTKKQLKKVRKGTYLLSVGKKKGNFKWKWLVYVEERKGDRITNICWLIDKGKIIDETFKIGRVNSGKFSLFFNGKIEEAWNNYILTKKEAGEYKLKLTESRI